MILAFVLMLVAVPAFPADSKDKESNAITAVPATGPAPLRIVFGNLDPDWNIDFGDGLSQTVQGGSFTQPVTHLFGWPGPFTVTARPSNRQVVVKVVGTDVPDVVFDKADELATSADYKAPSGNISLNACRYGAETLYSVFAENSKKKISEIWYYSPSGGSFGRRVAPSPAGAENKLFLDEARVKDCLPFKRRPASPR